MHRACAALPVIAAFLGSREPDSLAQRVEQRHARLDSHLHGRPLISSVIVCSPPIGVRADAGAAALPPRDRCAARRLP
jgi:hypothetical protein